MNHKIYKLNITYYYDKFLSLRLKIVYMKIENQYFIFVFFWLDQFIFDNEFLMNQNLIFFMISD